ncbi:MAG: hypothetical protein ACRDAX_04270 [Propionibacteriaceae bacterium]
MSTRNIWICVTVSASIGLVLLAVAYLFECDGKWMLYGVGGALLLPMLLIGWLAPASGCKKAEKTGFETRVSKPGRKGNSLNK